MEFQNQSRGGTTGLTTRVSPVAGLTTSVYGMPSTYFQWSSETLSGNNRLGAKLPWRNEADTTMMKGTSTMARKLRRNACASTLRMSRR
jgi:hypothetical protein